MNEAENLLDIALNDPTRKKYGLNIIFADKFKKPLQENWNRWIDQKQTDEDIKAMYKHSHTNYGYLTGFNGLVSIDFDAAWIYLEALEYFGERLNTFTVETPNGGYHAYFLTKHPKTYNKYKKSLKVEILGGMNTIVYGEAQNVEGEMVKYRPVNDEPIHRDDEIINDMTEFLRTTLTKYDFLSYKCIKEKLSQKINYLSHEQRLNLSNLFLQRKADITTATNFFRMCTDFDLKKTKYYLEYDKKKVDAGELKYPTCDKLAEDFEWDRANCTGCIRLLKKEQEPKKAKTAVKKTASGEVQKMTPDRLYEEVMNINRRITHGMHSDPDMGLMFTTTISGKKGVYGITNKRFIKAIHENDLDGMEVDKKQVVVRGYTNPLSQLTQTGIVNLTKKVGKHDKFLPERISDLFEDILDKVILWYLEYRENAESFMVTLWILGTYFRVFWVWYPYLTFAGLRDVGKSTSLTVLANTCFNGSGYVSGSSSEASILRTAASSKGLIVVDHYEEVKKNPDKRQVYTQLMENAWRLNASVDRVNTTTFEVEMYNIPCSIAVGTRYEDEVLDEKGIKITMFDTGNEQIIERSADLDEDPFFLTIQERCMATALAYQDKVSEAYNNIPRIPGLFGRDRNKFKPLLALAKVIDDENNNKWKLFERIAEYGIEYRKSRKQDVTDLEEVLLKVILEWNIESATYAQLGKKMREEGYSKYSWQTARTDMKKLGVAKWINRDKKPVVVKIDLDKAKKRAKTRGIQWTTIDQLDQYDGDKQAFETEDVYDDEEEETSEKSFEITSVEDLNDIQTDIIEICENKKHQTVDGAVMRSKIIDIIEAMYEKDRDDVEAILDDLIGLHKLYSPRMGFVKIRK